MLTGLMRLEERIVLDASGAAPDQNHDAGKGGDATALHADRDGDGGERGGERILVVDKALSGSSQLAEAAGDGVVVVEHDSRVDTLSELRDMIAAACEGRDILSIAFAGHGEQANFRLAQDASIDLASLSSDPALADFLRFIAETVGEDGRVDILGCDFAAGDAGAELLSSLEALTGVNFAASDDGTGNAERGGDWLLESDGVDAGRDYFDAERLAGFTGLLASNTFFDYYPEHVDPVRGDGLFESSPLDFKDFVELVEKSLDGLPHGSLYGSAYGKLYIDIRFDGGDSGYTLDQILGGLDRLNGLTAGFFSGGTMQLGSAYYGKFVIDSGTNDIFRVDSQGLLTYVATWSQTDPNVISAHYSLWMHFSPSGSQSNYYNVSDASYIKEGITDSYSMGSLYDCAGYLSELLNDGLRIKNAEAIGEFVISTYLSTWTEDNSLGKYDGTALSALAKIGFGTPVEDDIGNNRGNKGGGGFSGGNNDAGDNRRTDGLYGNRFIGFEFGGGDVDKPAPVDYFLDILGGREYEWVGGLGESLRGAVEIVADELSRLHERFDDLFDGDFGQRLSASLGELLSGFNTLNAATAKMLFDYSLLDASAGGELAGLVGGLAGRGEGLSADAMKVVESLGASARAWSASSPESRDGMAADRIAELVSRVERLNLDLRAATLAARAFSERVAERDAPGADAIRAYVEGRYREAMAKFGELLETRDRMFFDLKTLGAQGRDGAKTPVPSGGAGK